MIRLDADVMFVKRFYLIKKVASKGKNTRTTRIGINWQVYLHHGRLHRINAFSQNLPSSKELYLLTDDKTDVRFLALSLAESIQNGMTSFKRLPQTPPASFPGSSIYLEKVPSRGREKILEKRLRQLPTLVPVDPLHNGV